MAAPSIIRFQVPVPPILGVGPSLALSPDGSSIAFVAVDSTGVRLLHVRALDSNEVRQFPQVRQPLQIAWSPDSWSHRIHHVGRSSTTDAPIWQQERFKHSLRCQPCVPGWPGGPPVPSYLGPRPVRIPGSISSSQAPRCPVASCPERASDFCCRRSPTRDVSSSTWSSERTIAESASLISPDRCVDARRSTPRPSLTPVPVISCLRATRWSWRSASIPLECVFVGEPVVVAEQVGGGNNPKDGGHFGVTPGSPSHVGVLFQRDAAGQPVCVVQSSRQTHR